MDTAKLVDLVCAHFSHCRAIYLFGSQADGSATAESDIDIAILCKPMPAAQFWEATQAVACELGLDLDCIDLNRAPVTLRAEIVSSGTCIYRPDPKEVDSFEMYTISDYAGFQEIRNPIIADIKQRGSIYGS